MFMLRHIVTIFYKPHLISFDFLDFSIKYLSNATFVRFLAFQMSVFGAFDLDKKGHDSWLFLLK